MTINVIQKRSTTIITIQIKQVQKILEKNTLKIDQPFTSFAKTKSAKVSNLYKVYLCINERKYWNKNIKNRNRSRGYKVLPE